MIQAQLEKDSLNVIGTVFIAISLCGSHINAGTVKSNNKIITSYSYNSHKTLETADI